MFSLIFNVFLACSTTFKFFLETHLFFLAFFVFPYAQHVLSRNRTMIEFEIK